MQRAVDYLNERQQGEVQIDQIYLLPLMDFPNSVLRFKDFSWYENPVRPDSLQQEPIIYVHSLNLSLDIVQLIRGDIEVDQFSLENGFVNLHRYPDSIMNFERALGDFLSKKTSPGSKDGNIRGMVNVDKLELINIRGVFRDFGTEDHVNLLIEQMESKFAYLPGKVNANVELKLNISDLKYKEINLKNKNNILFSSHVILDPEHKIVQIEPSSLSIAGLELETWGFYDFLEEPGINIEFRASNTGLEVLNFLFLGILDLDEIEQIGSGSIFLDGRVSGSMGDKLPEVLVNGSARGLGFRVKALEREVEDIYFTLSASNGAKADFSEARVVIEDFTASFPEGSIQGKIVAENLVEPMLDINLSGDLDLEGLEQILDIEKLHKLEGKARFDCELSGTINRATDSFLEKAGTFWLSLEKAGLVYESDTLADVNGELYMDGNKVGSRDLNLDYNGNNMGLKIIAENLVEYILDYKRDVSIELAMDSDLIFPGRISSDTLISSLLGEEIRGLHFKAKASVSSEELDGFIDGDSLPAFTFALDSFGVNLPVYADISHVNASLAFDHDSLSLHYLNGTIGESQFSFSGKMLHPGALINKETQKEVELEFKLSSPRMRADDLFSYNEGFLLPEIYRSEFMEDFFMSGLASFPVDGILYDSIDLDYGIELSDMGWHFRYYPMALDQISLNIRKNGDDMIINRLEGNIGESNLQLSAIIRNFSKASLDSIQGKLVLESELLDFNQLLNYQIPDELKDNISEDSLEFRDPPRLGEMDFPDFTFRLNVGELRYGENTLYGLNGSFRSGVDKVLHLDSLLVSGKSGGSLGLTGSFDLSEQEFYRLNTEMNLKGMNIRDLNFKMQSGDEVFTLKDNFAGLVSGSGSAKIFFRPDLKLDMDSTTGLFHLEVNDGALINFTPLEKAGKYMDNKNLDHVRFSTLKNSFTLKESKIIVPLMGIESSIGLLLIEGEQGFDNSYLYLLRVPPRLVMDAAKSSIGKAKDDGKEDEIDKMKMGNFVMMTIWGDGVESVVEKGDQREKYRK